VGLSGHFIFLSLFQFWKSRAKVEFLIKTLNRINAKV